MKTWLYLHNKTQSVMLTSILDHPVQQAKHVIKGFPFQTPYEVQNKRKNSKTLAKTKIISTNQPHWVLYEFSEVYRKAKKGVLSKPFIKKMFVKVGKLFNTPKSKLSPLIWMVKTTMNLLLEYWIITRKS